MRSSRWLLALVLVAAPAGVAIGSPIAFSIGAGIRIPLSEAPHPLDEPFDQVRGEAADGTTPVGALGAMIGYRLSPRIAIGVRGAVSWRDYRTSTHALSDQFHDRFSEIPIDVALALPYDVGHVGSQTFYVMPWLGRRFTRHSTTVVDCLIRSGVSTCDPSRTYIQWRSTGNAFGLTTALTIAGGRVWQAAIFVEAQIADEHGSALGVGLEFRR